MAGRKTKLSPAEMKKRRRNSPGAKATKERLASRGIKHALADKPKSDAHRKAISDGLKRYWAAQKKRNPNAGKLTAHGKKAAADRKAGKPSKDFTAYHKRHEETQKARAASSKKFYASPEGEKVQANAKKLATLGTKAHGLRLKARFGGKNSKAAAEFKKVQAQINKLSAEQRKLHAAYRAKTKK